MLSQKLTPELESILLIGCYFIEDCNASPAEYYAISISML